MEEIQNTVPEKPKQPLLKTLPDFLSKTPVVLSLIIILTIIVFGQTLYFGYTYLDDRVIIVQNIQSEKHIFNLKEAFSRDAFFSKDGLAFYRPLQNVSYMVDTILGGKKVYMYHLVNLIFHILTCFSIFYLFKLLKYDKKVAALVTILYTVHPMFTHAVAWIPSRGDLMIALFGILSFIAFIKFFQTKNYIFYAINILTFLLALFSKETAALMPIVFAGYYFIVMKKKKIPKELWVLVGVYIVSILVFLVARNNVVITQPGDNSFSMASFIKNLPTLPELIAKFIVPIDLSTMPRFTPLMTTTGIIFMFIIVALVIFRKDKRIRMMLFGTLWFLLFAVPAMAYRHNYADFGFEYFEHRAYLPMIGLMVLLIELYKSYKMKIKPEYLLIGTLILTVFFSVYTFMNAKYYRDVYSFFGRATEQNPNSALAFFNLGNYYKEKQNAKMAIYNLGKAIEVNPNYIEAYNNLADVYNYLGKKDDAIALLERAVQINRYYYNAWKFLGVLYTNSGNYRKAVDILYQAQNLRHNDHELYNAFGAAYADMNNKDSAEIMFKKALEIKPDYIEASKNLSELYKKSGNLAKSTELLVKSTEQIEKANKNDPTKAVDNYITLGELYGRQGQFDKSLEVLEKVIQLDPKNHRAYNNMGTAYAIQKKFSLAVKMFENAVKYNPTNDSYLTNLGLAYNDNKQRAKAIETMKKAAQIGSPSAKQWLLDNKIK